MARTIGISFLLLFAPMVIVFGQSGFNKLLETESSYNIDLDDILYDDNKIFVRGNIFIDSIGRWGLFVAALDTNGIVLWQNIISDTVTNSHILADSPSRFIRLQDGSFALGVDYASLDKLGLIQLDHVGNLIHSNTYTYEGFAAFPKTIAYYDKHFYMIGQIQKPDYTMDLFVIKTDSVGKMIWNRNLGTTEYDERFFGDVINNQDGTFTISAVRYSLNYTDQVDQGWMAPWLVTIDTSTQIINQWLGQQNDYKTRGGGPTIHLESGEWIIGSTEHKMGTDSMFGIIVNGPTVTKLRANKNLVWKKYLTAYVLPIDVLWDAAYDETRKEIILAGEKVIQLTATKGAHEGWIIKLNDSGEILWSRIDTMLDRTDYVVKHQLVGIDISPWGSCYICGNVEEIFKYYGWVIKVTPDGCIDTLCTTTSIAEQLKPIKSISISPNPADDFIDVKSKSEIVSYKIFDTSGIVKMNINQTSSGDTRINVTNLPTGLYIMQVVTIDRQISTSKFVVTY